MMRAMLAKGASVINITEGPCLLPNEPQFSLEPRRYVAVKELKLSYYILETL